MTDARSLAPGTRVDNFEILGPCGAGGMAVVYRARDVELDRIVALKLISDQNAPLPTYLRRFRSEAQITAKIDHPNVVPVYGYGVFAERPYIVMRFVEGENLQRRLEKRGRLDPETAVATLTDVAAALDASHAANQVHRDVKPANILLEDASGRVFLSDFGIAKSLGDLASTTVHLGTKGYIAPERLSRRENTPLVDVFSLGVVLWDMLAGLHAPLPTDPGGRSPDGLDPPVPPPLVRVVQRAVQTRPADRHPSAGALAAAARAALHAVEPRELPLPHVPPGWEPLTTDLRRQVRAVCERALEPITDPGLRGRIERIRDRLTEPLAVAVAGKISAGKSTLVNALLDQPVAQTGAGETTRVITWYRHGPEQVELVLRGGARRTMSLTPEGRLPDLPEGVGARDVVAMEVSLQIDALEGLTLIDTPGLEGLEAGTEAALSVIGAAEETAALKQADALLFAIDGDARAVDRDVLEAFHARFDRSGASAINAVGVLTKADAVSPDGDDWDAAVEQAASLRQTLGPLVSAIVPVSGILAETANTGRFNRYVADALHKLAALDSEQRAELLVSARDFVRAPAPIPAGEREVLFRLLGRFGIRRMLELADAGRLDAFEGTRRLRELSGIDEIRAELDRLRLRADAIRAGGALRELDDLYWQHRAELQPLYDDIAELRATGPDMHLLPLMDQFSRCARGEVRLRADQLRELERLLTGRTAAERLGLDRDAPSHELVEAAEDRGRRWHSFGLEAGPSVRRVAEAAETSYQQLARALALGRPTAAAAR